MPSVGVAAAASQSEPDSTSSLLATFLSADVALLIFFCL